MVNAEVFGGEVLGVTGCGEDCGEGEEEGDGEGFEGWEAGGGFCHGNFCPGL